MEELSIIEPNGRSQLAINKKPQMKIEKAGLERSFQLQNYYERLEYGFCLYWKKVCCQAKPKQKPQITNKKQKLCCIEIRNVFTYTRYLILQERCLLQITDFSIVLTENKQPISSSHLLIGCFERRALFKLDVDRVAQLVSNLLT